MRLRLSFLEFGVRGASVSLSARRMACSHGLEFEDFMDAAYDLTGKLANSSSTPPSPSFSATNGMPSRVALRHRAHVLAPVAGFVGETNRESDSSTDSDDTSASEAENIAEWEQTRARPASGFYKEAPNVRSVRTPPPSASRIDPDEYVTRHDRRALDASSSRTFSGTKRSFAPLSDGPRTPKRRRTSASRSSQRAMSSNSSLADMDTAASSDGIIAPVVSAAPLLERTNGQLTSRTASHSANGARINSVDNSASTKNTNTRSATSHSRSDSNLASLQLNSQGKPKLTTSSSTSSSPLLSPSPTFDHPFEEEKTEDLYRRVLDAERRANEEKDTRLLLEARLTVEKTAAARAEAALRDLQESLDEETKRRCAAERVMEVLPFIQEQLNEECYQHKETRRRLEGQLRDAEARVQETDRARVSSQCQADESMRALRAECQSLSARLQLADTREADRKLQAALADAADVRHQLQTTEAEVATQRDRAETAIRQAKVLQNFQDSVQMLLQGAANGR
jgi:hypothetical protein